MSPDSLETEMTASQLALVVNSLNKPDDETAPLTAMLENSLDVGPGRGRATYRDQKHHWTRWLNDYQCPDRPAKRIYNAINCPTMLFWLAEAVGVEQRCLVSAIYAAKAAPSNQISQTAAIRRVIGWGSICDQLAMNNVSA